MTAGLELATTPWVWNEEGLYGGLCEQAEQAEALGFHSLWLPENHFGDARSIPSPLTLLAAVAARTSRLKLGCTSYLLPIRNALQAAEEVAVLDRLSGGRLILGLGRGMQASMFRAFGVEPREKRALFAANLDLMRRAWRGEPVAVEGEKPIRLAPLPVQQPSPPLWVAAFGPLALQQVANLGLPYLASPIEPLAVLEDNYRQHRDAVAGAGLPEVPVVPVMRAVFVASGGRATAVRDGLVKTLPPRLREGVADTQEWSIVGEPSYVRDRVQEYTERLGMTHLILRGGIPGLDASEHLRSHEAVMAALHAA